DARSKSIKSARLHGKKLKRPAERSRCAMAACKSKRSRTKLLIWRGRKRRAKRTRRTDRQEKDRLKGSRERKRKHRGKVSGAAGDAPNLANGFGVSKHGQDTGIAPPRFIYASGDCDCAFRRGDYDSGGQPGGVAGMVPDGI